MTITTPGPAAAGTAAPVEIASPLGAGPAWDRRNVRVTMVFGPFLVLAGIVGWVAPDPNGLFSSAVPYDIFHIVAGLVAIALLVSRRPRAAAGFNFCFGLIDLWQALAGVLGWFPAAWFALRPADHVIHVVLGIFLAGIGAAGLLQERRR